MSRYAVLVSRSSFAGDIYDGSIDKVVSVSFMCGGERCVIGG